MATPPSSPPRAPALCARFLGDHAKPEKPKPGSCSPQAVGIPRQQPRWAPHRPRAATTSASHHYVEPDYRLLREVVAAPTWPSKACILAKGVDSSGATIGVAFPPSGSMKALPLSHRYWSHKLR